MVLDAMTWAVSVVVLGFSLPDSGPGRRLAHDHPPPPPSHPLPPHSPPGSPPYNECDYPSGGKSCDGDPQTADCDVQDEEGEWTRSCDMHHTTSCDDIRDCTWPPPPPLLPAPPGGYLPPPSPPPEENLDWLPFAVLVLVLVALLCCCWCVVIAYDDTRRREREGRLGQDRAWWHFHCCCCIEWWRSANWDTVEGEHRWRDGRDSGWRSAKLSPDAEADKQARLEDALRRAAVAKQLSAAGRGAVGSNAKRDFRSPSDPRVRS